MSLLWKKQSFFMANTINNFTYLDRN